MSELFETGVRTVLINLVIKNTELNAYLIQYFYGPGEVNPNSQSLLWVLVYRTHFYYIIV